MFCVMFYNPYLFSFYYYSPYEKVRQLDIVGWWVFLKSCFNVNQYFWNSRYKIPQNVFSSIRMAYVVKTTTLDLTQPEAGSREIFVKIRSLQTSQMSVKWYAKKNLF